MAAALEADAAAEADALAAGSAGSAPASREAALLASELDLIADLARRGGGFRSVEWNGPEGTAADVPFEPEWFGLSRNLDPTYVSESETEVFL